MNKDWGCVILREIDFLLKICWSIPCLHPSWKVHTFGEKNDFYLTSLAGPPFSVIPMRVDENFTKLAVSVLAFQWIFHIPVLLLWNLLVKGYCIKAQKVWMKVQLFLVRVELNDLNQWHKQKNISSKKSYAALKLSSVFHMPHLFGILISFT